MKHIKTWGICLIAIFALGALVSGTASAAKFVPEWGQCVKTESGSGGHYANEGCTEKAKKHKGAYLGAYEWYPQEVSPEVGEGEATLHDRIPAEDQPVSQTTIKTAGGLDVTCEGLRETTVLEITGPVTTLGAPFLAFQGCHVAGTPLEEGNDCSTTDAERDYEVSTGDEHQRFYHGETPTWNGTLTVLEPKSTDVGYVWKTSPAKEQFLAQLQCESGPVLGAIIGGDPAAEDEAFVSKIEPVNTMSASHTVTFAPPAHKLKGVKPVQALVNNKWEPVTIEATMLFPETEGVGSNAEPHNLEIEGQLELKATK